MKIRTRPGVPTSVRMARKGSCAVVQSFTSWTSLTKRPAGMCTAVVKSSRNGAIRESVGWYRVEITGVSVPRGINSTITAVTILMSASWDGTCVRTIATIRLGRMCAAVHVVLSFRRMSELAMILTNVSNRKMKISAEIWNAPTLTAVTSVSVRRAKNWTSTASAGRWISVPRTTEVVHTFVPSSIGKRTATVRTTWS
uniref:(northern house mosquito) hypothetical protein n=1 Tax=Culex pipiens TaxID=7175 RepID=A0A8D8IBR4_CULPI